MTTLGTYLRSNQRKPPRHPTVGAESGWLSFCKLELTTGSLWAGDPCRPFPEDGFVFRLPTGTYLIEAKGMDFDGSKFISRLRVRLAHADDPKRGKQVGQTGTDSAAIAVCDIKALEAAIGEDKDTAYGQIDRQMGQDYGIIRVRGRKVVSMPYVASGFGDGCGPVFELRSNRKRVGMELEFISADGAVEEPTPLPASGWVGGECKAGRRLYLWSDHPSGPVEYRIRQGKSAIIKDWARMRKQPADGGPDYGASVILGAGKFAVDFRVGTDVFATDRVTIR